MKKGIMVLIAIAVLVSAVAPVMADTIFNEMSKNISTWKNPICCSSCKGTTEQAPAAATAAPAKAMKCSKCSCSVNALGDKVPCKTVN